MSDHERIYLEPLCCVYHGDRQWCEHDVWPQEDCGDHSPAIEYIRADIAGQQERAAIIAFGRHRIPRSEPTMDPVWTAAFNSGIDYLCDAIERGDHE